MDKKTYAVIYCRVSSTKQVIDGHGLDSQEKRYRDYCISHGYKLLKVFLEEGVSGALMHRPAMEALIELITQWNITKQPDDEIVVIFDDLKRFSRDLETHMYLKREIQSKGARIECLNYNFDESPTGRFIETVMASYGQLDRELNADQVKQKMKARAELGYWPFGSAVGFKFEKVPGHGKLLIKHKPFATIYKSAIEGFADRYLSTPDEVKEYINKQYALYGIKKKNIA